ncbi:MAG: hypothetical protein U9Q20_06075 [Campylobacterota bacterium]|nr:hypothetical protein [Campylobacterota bacterium]
MSKKSFSLIEIIFVISIAVIIAMVAIPKLGSSLDKANMVKIKSDVALIRDGLSQYEDKMILSNESTALDSLEDSEDILFDKILQYPIVSSTEQKSLSWSKLSNSSYQVWITSSESLIFNYNKDDFTFDCNFDDNYCEELTQ